MISSLRKTSRWLAQTVAGKSLGPKSPFKSQAMLWRGFVSNHPDNNDKESKNKTGFGKFSRTPKNVKKANSSRDVQEGGEGKPSEKSEETPRGVPSSSVTPNARPKEEENLSWEEVEEVFKEENKKMREKGEKETKEEGKGRKKENPKIKVTNYSKDQDKEKTPPGGERGKPPPPPSPRSFLLPASIALLLWLMTSKREEGEEGRSKEECTIDKFFQAYVKEGRCKRITIKRKLDKDHCPTYEVAFTPAKKTYFFYINNLEFFLAQLKTFPNGDSIKISFNQGLAQEVKSYMNSEIFSGVLKVALVGGLLFLLNKFVFKNKDISGQLGEMNSKEKEFSNRLLKEAQNAKKLSKVKFEDVAGMGEAKREIVEFVDFLKNKSQYKKLGAKLPRGALLTGPPGTGKTLLVKACAHESDVSFISMAGSEFVEMYQGVGASRVRTLFEVAKKTSPCIIFIDEIDAVGARRRENVFSSEVESTLNQLLVELDGFDANPDIIVFAATNRKDILDPALLRPGRLDRIIDVPLPDIEARKKIFEVHLKKLNLTKESSLEVYSKRLASLTPNFSGAEIANICNEAATIAARLNQENVKEDNFEKAVERVVGGIERKVKLTDEQKRLTALHGAGKGVASWFLKNGDPLLKLSIIPHSKSTKGFSQYLSNENFLETKSDIMDSICVTLAGGVAEEMMTGSKTTAVLEDYHKAELLAHKLVSTFGMGAKGPVRPTKYHDNGLRDFSESKAASMDEQKRLILQECEEITKKLLTEKREFVEKLTEAVLAKESINFNEIKEILGERPFPPKSSFRTYLQEVNHHEEDTNEGDGKGGESGQSEEPQEPVAITIDKIKKHFMF